MLICPVAPSETLVDSALRFFLGKEDATAQRFDLDKSWPQHISPECRAVILDTPPTVGRIRTVEKNLQQKLDSLEAVLRLQQRKSVYQICVFNAEPKAFAFVSLHERAVLIFDAAPALLNAEDLQASTAHEIGYEYVWEEYNHAAARHDNRRLKEMELFCGAVAILTRES